MDYVSHLVLLNKIRVIKYVNDHPYLNTESITDYFLSSSLSLSTNAKERLPLTQSRPFTLPSASMKKIIPLLLTILEVVSNVSPG